MIGKKLVSVALITLLSTCAVAQPMSSKVDFGGGTVSPTASFDMDLTKLVHGISYDVNCKITNPNQAEVIMGVTPYYPVKYLDNTPLMEQAHLAPGPHTLVIQQVSKGTMYGDTLSLINSDQSESLKIENCYAVAR